MLNAAENGLVIVSASIFSYDMSPSPSRYFRTPTGPDEEDQEDHVSDDHRHRGLPRKRRAEQADGRRGQASRRDDRQEHGEGPEPVAQLGDEQVGEQELLGQQKRQDGRDPERGDQLGEDDLAGRQQRRQQAG